MTNSLLSRPRRPAGPRRSEIDTALNLLTALGSGNSEGKKLLTELQKAAGHNERLLAELNEKLKRFSDLEQREQRLADLKSEVESKFLKLEKIRADFESYSADVDKGVYG